MGNNNQLSFLPAYDHNLWIIQARQKLYDIVRNSQTGIIAQSYNIPIGYSLNLIENIQRYQIRKKKNINFVKVYEVSRSENSYLCKGNPTLKVVTERIPIRLSKIHNLQIQEGLYIYNQVLNSSKYMLQIQPFFNIYDQCIGFTVDGQVRLWLNQNYGYNYPNQQTLQLKRSLFKKRNVENNLQLNLINEIYLVIQPHLQSNKFPKKFQDQFKNNKPQTIKQMNIFIETYIKRERLDKLRSIKNKLINKFPTDIYTNISQNTQKANNQIKPSLKFYYSNKPIKTQNNFTVRNHQPLRFNKISKLQTVQPIQVISYENIKTQPIQSDIKININFINNYQSPKNISQQLFKTQTFSTNIIKQTRSQSQKINNPPQNILFKVDQNPQSLKSIMHTKSNTNIKRSIPVEFFNRQGLRKSNNNRLISSTSHLPSILRQSTDKSIHIKLNQDNSQHQTKYQRQKFTSNTSLGTNSINALNNQFLVQKNNQMSQRGNNIKIQTSQKSSPVNNIRVIKSVMMNQSTNALNNSEKKYVQNQIQISKMQGIKFANDVRKVESKVVGIYQSNYIQDQSQKKNLSKFQQNNQNLNVPKFHRTESFSEKRQSITQERESKQITQNQIEQIKNEWRKKIEKNEGQNQLGSSLLYDSKFDNSKQIKRNNDFLLGSVEINNNQFQSNF